MEYTKRLRLTECDSSALSRALVKYLPMAFFPLLEKNCITKFRFINGLSVLLRYIPRQPRFLATKAHIQS